MANDTSAALSKGAPSRGKPARSKATRWRAAVLIGVHVLAAIHIAHWMTTGSTVSPLEPSESMEFAKNSVVNAGLVFFAITILSTLILGRWFCGWACHVVALQDLSRALLLKVGIRPRPMRSRWMMLVPLAAGFYMFLWPLVHRLFLAEVPEPASQVFTPRGTEWTKEGFWDTFTTSWVMAALTFFIAGFVAVYFLGAKGFCTYACPYGAVFGTVDRLSPGRIRVTDACVQCGHCSLTCTSNVDISREVHDYGMVVDPGCMKCMDCVSVCPEDALYFGFGKPAILAKPIRDRRPAPKPIPLVEEVVGLVATAFAYFAWRGWRQEGDFLLSLGIAITFGFLAVTTLRLVRRSDVKWPGWTLKRAGRATAPALVLGVGVVVLAAVAVPYGISLEWSAQKALRAEAALDPVKARWFQPGGQELSGEEREAAETLLASAEQIDARAGRETLFNTMRIVWASLFLGEEAKFEAALERALAAPHAGPDPRIVRARTLVAAGEPEDAIEVFESIVADYPEWAAAYVDIARLHAQDGDTEAAAAVLERGMENCPESGGIVALHALVLLERGDVDGAASELERAAELTPDEHQTRQIAWSTLRDIGRFDAAARVLRAGLDREGAPVTWRADLAQVLFAANRPGEAAEEARALARTARGDRRLMTVAAYILEQTGHADEAAAIGAAMPPMDVQSSRPGGDRGLPAGDRR